MNIIKLNGFEMVKIGFNGWKSLDCKKDETTTTTITTICIFYVYLPI